MDCLWAKYRSEYGKAEYLKNPDQFDADFPKSGESYKHVVYLINPGESERNFRVHSVGVEVAFPEKDYINRSLPYDTAFHYVMDGEGRFNGQIVRRGDFFFVPRGEKHSLSSVPGTGFKMYWILVRHASDVSFEQFGLNPEREIFRYWFEADVERIFREMLAFQPYRQDVHLYFLSRFYELMSFQKMNFPPNGAILSRSRQNLNYIVMAKRMWEDTAWRMSVDEMAKTLGFSRKHFSEQFLQLTGTTPKKYLLTKRVEFAKEQIENDKASLKSLAFYLGYEDYSAFSRVFKKQVGINPAEYREAHRAQEEKE